AFVDYDRDGWLDLYVGNYVDFSPSDNKVCVSAAGLEDYCSPNVYGAVSDRLFRNRRDGTFEDVTTSSGLLAAYGNALGVIPEDFDGDGWIDIFVANDGNDNQLWMNRGDGTFVDEALERGCAVNMEGRAEASMGVDVGDFDRDGDLDLFMTHLRHETNTLYVNRGDGTFDDLSVSSDLGLPSRDFTGFGTAWLDYDLDGWLDLLVVNGAVQSLDPLVAVGDPFPLHQKDQLFHNLGNGRFRDISAEAGPYFELSDVGRGAAFGDIDNDGDTDVIITNNNGPARLLLNEADRRGASVGLILQTATGPKDALGARIGIDRTGEPTVWHRVRTAGSYASAGDPRWLLGVAPDGGVERVRVVWPSGRIETWETIEPDRYTILVEGAGAAVTDPR
ncbi:MAG: CRTAC1 family protein, partial [Acidobacteriota bacterium]|nr:CRTAC1 family protein [Acidobacteriota bacterium]